MNDAGVGEAVNRYRNFVQTTLGLTRTGAGLRRFPLSPSRHPENQRLINWPNLIEVTLQKKNNQIFKKSGRLFTKQPRRLEHPPCFLFLACVCVGMKV